MYAIKHDNGTPSGTCVSKLDDLIAQLESPQPFERALVLAELRRLQARERRLEELEAKWRERWSVYSERRAGFLYDTVSRDMQAELERCQDELRTIREET